MQICMHCALTQLAYIPCVPDMHTEPVKQGHLHVVYTEQLIYCTPNIIYGVLHGSIYSTSDHACVATCGASAYNIV
jgi:hypothetical protein